MDIFSKKKRSEIMSRVRNKDSKMEISLRKALWAEGFRYRKNDTKYFGKPDLVLAKYKTVIFIDSCFWHGCPEHYGAPATRKKFWEKKIDRNKERDEEVNLHYSEKGWKAVRVWEHDLEENFQKELQYIANRLNKAN